MCEFGKVHGAELSIELAGLVIKANVLRGAANGERGIEWLTSPRIRNVRFRSKHYYSAGF